MRTQAPTPNPPADTVRRLWLRRLTWSVAALLAVWLLAWLLMPPLLKWQLQKQASALLGRTVTVEKVDFRPWTLELTLEGLRVADAAGTGEQFSVGRVYANAELQSLLRLAPVVDAIQVERPRLYVRHLGEGRYDLDDVLARLSQPSEEDASSSAHFALFNIHLSGGEVDFVDDRVNRVHQLRALSFDLPFLSNLDSRREVVTQPRLAFVLNGSAFDSQAASTPFAQNRETEASIRIPALDLQPYLAYWPAQWPLRPEAGVLDLALKLQFEWQQAPRVSVSGAVGLSDFRMHEVAADGTVRDGLSFERLEVQAQAVQIFQRRADLRSIQLVAPRLSLSRDAAGQTNIQRLAERFGALVPTPPGPAAPGAQVGQAPAPRSDEAAWQVAVERVALERGELLWSDAAVQPSAQLALGELQVGMTGLSWPMQAPVPFEASALLGQTPLSLSGSATDVAASATLALGEFPLRALAPYLAQVLKPGLDGRVQGDAALEWKAAQGTAPMSLLLRAPQVDFNALRLGTPKQPLASLERLHIENLALDLVQRTVAIEKTVLTRPIIPLERDAEGQWMAQRWMVPSQAQPRPAATPASESLSEPWKLLLSDLQIEAGAVTWKDALPARPVHLVFSALKLRLQNLRPLDGQQVAMPVSLALRLGAGQASQADPGRLDFTGSLRLPSPVPSGKESLLVRGKLQAESLPVHALEPYFGDQLNMELLRADASYKGMLEVGLPPQGLALKLEGDLALDEFRANTRSPSEDLLAWKSLGLRGLRVGLQPGAATQVQVAETVLSDYFARIIVDETGRINLQGLVKSEPATGTGTVAASSTAADPTAGPPADIRFGPVSLVNGRVYFSDRFIRPNYSANLSELTGALSAFSNASTPTGGTPQLADLRLRGRAEGTASLEIVGKLNPLAQPLALDIKGEVRDLELPPLSPYSVKYAGYGMERGKLSVDVSYRIEPNGQLTASNQIILNQLRFGERVAGSEAPNLPVKLAVALLADRNGVIDINLPVSGSINDPQFRLGPVIFRLIFNLIGKALTAPFSLLASALGGGGDELSQVAFAPGRAQLDDEAKKRLDLVAKALGDRPALQLTVVGHSDLEAERSAYQRARLDERVLAEKRRLQVRAGQAVSATLAVSPAEYPALLKAVYSRADVPKPRNFVGIAKDIPQAEMESLLLASVPVEEDAMRELAVARAVAVKDYMAQRELPEARMFLGAPQLKAAGGSWKPQAALELAPR